MEIDTPHNISVVYRDEHLVVVNKPSGLLCVPGLKEPDNLFDRVKHHFPNALVVHRLDMATSGLVVFALHIDIQRAISKAFEKREVKKHYIAVVDGIIEATHGEIHCPVICDWPNRPLQKVDWLHGKMGITFFETLLRDKEELTTRVKLKPHTGRTHQLRVHMWDLGFPILGDEFYNENNSQNKANRLLLHAEELSFTHPITQKTLSVQSKASF